MRAVERCVLRARDPKKRRGLIWHTQGSGKTFTMITAARLILERQDVFGKATVLLVIDRNELEGQLMAWVDRLLGELFAAYVAEPRQLPPPLAIIVADVPQGPHQHIDMSYALRPLRMAAAILASGRLGAGPIVKYAGGVDTRREPPEGARVDEDTLPRTDAARELVSIHRAPRNACEP